MKLRKAFTGILAFAVLAWSMGAQTKETTKKVEKLHQLVQPSRKLPVKLLLHYVLE